jgi:hypothetical protein
MNGGALVLSRGTIMVDSMAVLPLNLLISDLRPNEITFLDF